MKYKWHIPLEAKTMFDVYKAIAIERKFNRSQMDNFIKNNVFYNDASTFKNIDLIVDKIKDAIKTNKKITVFSDYDCDGVCSCYILYLTLKHLNANVNYILPHRLKDGYGIRVKSIDRMKEEGTELIITTDNGIAAIDAVNRANELNIDIIITDHHQPQEELPNCLFLDAHVEGSGYPFKELCGAGVAFKLSSLLIDDFKNCDIYYELLIACSLATVADQMLLIGENRRIVMDGLEAINTGKASFGINKLLDILNIDKNNVNSGNIGFGIAPCINASGRLDSPDNSLKLLLSDCDSEADYYANKIHSFNEKRKELQNDIFEKIQVDDEDKCIIVTIEGNVAGIAGILASKISEKYLKPTFVFHDDGDKLSGSARTYGEFPIIDCLNNSRDIILNGGGHAAACGLALKKDNLELFKKSCNDTINSWQLENPDKLDKCLNATCGISFDLINNKLINNINKLEPFGNGNEEPIFATKNVEIIEDKIIGKLENVVKFKLKENGVIIDGIGFEPFKNKYCEAGYPKKINLMYKVKLNEFPKGTFKKQLICIDFKAKKS